VLAAAVRRLSSSAVRDEWVLINDQKSGQSTFAAIATSGSVTNTPPMTART
jgi:hypothetical protein